MSIPNPLTALPPTLQTLILRFTFGGVLFAGLYIGLYRYSLASIVVHGLYMLVLMTATFCTAHYLRNHSSPWLRLLAIPMLFLCLFLLASSYIANYIASYFWGQPMYDGLLINSYALLWNYYADFFSNIEHLHKGLESYPFLVGSLLIGLVGILVVISLLLWITLRCIRTLQQTQSLALTQVLSIIAISTLMQYTLVKTYAYAGWRGDLLIDTFFSSSDFLFSNPHREQLAQQDRAAFDQYRQRVKTLQQQSHQQTDSSKPINVILIIVDALRGDFLVDPNYPPPFLSHAIEQQTLQWLPNAYSTCSYSTCGIMSIITSKDVEHLHPNNVIAAEVFAAAGYKTISILSGNPNWYGFKDMYEPRYDIYIDSDNSPHVLMDDDIIIDNLAKLELNRQQPFFAFLRLMSTHEYGKVKPAFMHQGSSEYGNRVLQADFYLAKIFDLLAQKQVLDNTVVLITGDHGESIGEKGRWGHNISLYHSQLHVPILIHDPTRQYIEPPMASTLDAIVTLVDRAGLPKPPFWQGLSLLEPVPSQRFLFHTKAGARFQTDPMHAVTLVQQDKLYKYIFRGTVGVGGGNRPKKEELFELYSDPHESRNLMNDEALANIREQIKDQFEQHFGYRP